MLGIGSIVKYSVPKKKICNYKGQGWKCSYTSWNKKDEVLGYYIPKTFFVEKLGVSGIDSYIDKQKKIIAKKKNRIIML